jgi:hypothetical protein
VFQNFDTDAAIERIVLERKRRPIVVGDFIAVRHAKALGGFQIEPDILGLRVDPIQLRHLPCTNVEQAALALGHIGFEVFHDRAQLNVKNAAQREQEFVTIRGLHGDRFCYFIHLITKIIMGGYHSDLHNNNLGCLNPLHPKTATAAQFWIARKGFFHGPQMACAHQMRRP